MQVEAVRSEEGLIDNIVFESKRILYNGYIDSFLEGYYNKSIMEDADAVWLKKVYGGMSNQEHNRVINHR